MRVSGILAAAALLLACHSVDASSRSLRGSYVKPVDNSCMAAIKANCGGFAGLLKDKLPAVAAMLSDSSTFVNGVTILCPSDAALMQASIPKGTKVSDVLLYHMNDQAKVNLYNPPNEYIPNALEKTWTVTVTKGSVTVNGAANSANVVAGPIQCGCNGNLFVIDAVLLPEAPCVSPPPPSPACASPPPVCVSSPPPKCVSPPPVCVSSPPPKCYSPPPKCYSPPPKCVSPPPSPCPSPSPSPSPVCVASPPPKCVSPPPSPCPSPSPSPSPSPVCVASPPPKCVSPPPSPCPSPSPSPSPSPVCVSSPPPKCVSPPPKCVSSPPPKCVSSPPPKCYSPPPKCVSSPPPKCVSPPPKCVSSPPPKCVSPPPKCIASPPPCAACTTVYAQLAANPDFSILKAAVDAVGLDALLSDDTFKATVFAPTNQAFAKLLGTLNTNLVSLLADKDLLMTVLRNHVVPAQRLAAADLTQGLYIDTLAATTLQTAVVNGKVVVQTSGCSTYSTVIQADILSCKAYVHVVDTVILPK